MPGSIEVLCQISCAVMQGCFDMGLCTKVQDAVPAGASWHRFGMRMSCSAGTQAWWCPFSIQEL